MTNELRRRLEVIGENLTQNEKNEIIDVYTQQLINSEYNWRQARDIIVSGLKGQVRREKRRERLGIPKFRSGKYSLNIRTEKRLLEKYNWFRRKKAEENEDKVESEDKKKDNRWCHYMKKKPVINALIEEKNEREKIEEPPKAVIFVPNTKDSELASEIRKVIENLKPWTRMNIKVVERAGDKLMDLLCKSNPWDGEDCERPNCFTCETALKYGEKEKIDLKNCRQRSIIYQTWCQTCKEKDSDKNVIEGADIDNGEKAGPNKKRKKEKEKKEGPVYQYIGESSRSMYERGNEHLKDLEHRRTKSHILRHCEDVHPEMSPEDVKFGMKQLSSHRTAFERQIREAVLIDEKNGPFLLNSKLEYTRCCIPKMALKIGNKEEPVDPLKMKEKI